MGNIGTDLGDQHLLTAEGIVNSLRCAVARTLRMLQALETDENAARAMQHEQKKAVHWELWQSPVKTGTTTVTIAKPINPNAVRTLLALQEQATRTSSPKSNAKSNEKSAPTKAAPPATRKRKWESESENEESEEPEEDEGEDEEEEYDSDASDEGVTQTTPAKGMKWSYVPYQAEASDEWTAVPAIARRFYEPRGMKVSDELVAEAERTKSTIYWLPDDATDKSWNVEGPYLAARIAFRTPKEAELYCKGMTLALKKRRMKEQQQKEREARKARKAEAAAEPAAPPAPLQIKKSPRNKKIRCQKVQVRVVQRLIVQSPTEGVFFDCH